jgi:hypothetical protein
MPIYDRGDLVRSSATFTNSAGTATDPTTVIARVRVPNTNRDAYTTYTYGVGGDIVKDSTGTYHIDVSCTIAGTYYVRWEGTGAVQQAEEDTWDVDAGAFNPT